MSGSHDLVLIAYSLLKAAGRWLRIWIAVDAIVVLCGGVLTGKPGMKSLEIVMISYVA